MQSCRLRNLRSGLFLRHGAFKHIGPVVQNEDVGLLNAGRDIVGDDNSHVGQRFQLAAIPTQQGNAGIADMLSWNELVGQGWQRHQQLPAIMEGIKNTEIRRITRSYFQQKPFIVRVRP